MTPDYNKCDTDNVICLGGNGQQWSFVKWQYHAFLKTTNANGMINTVDHCALTNNDLSGSCDFMTD